jgi:hypothetical protein
VQCGTDAKGKVEAGVKYAQNNALRGRKFTSLAEQNAFLLEWERTVADTRIHGTTRKQVIAVFTELEAPALRPLPGSLFPVFEEGRRRVHRDGHVEVQRAYYSVPPEYLDHELWVRWEARLVRIFDARMNLIAVHTRHDPGRFSTIPAHIHPNKRRIIERGADWLLGRAALVGKATGRWAAAMYAPSADPPVSVSSRDCCRWWRIMGPESWNAPASAPSSSAPGACAICVPCWRPNHHKRSSISSPNTHSSAL